MNTAIKARRSLTSVFIAMSVALSSVATPVMAASEDLDARIARSTVETCLKKVRGITAYRYTYERYYSNPHVPAYTRKEPLQQLKGTVVVPGKLYLIEPSSNAGGETIVSGDQHYYRNSPSDSWHEKQLSSDLRRMVHPLQEVLSILKDRQAASWTFDTSKNQLKLEYKQRLEFDVDHVVEVLIDQRTGYVLEVDAKGRGSFPQVAMEGHALKTEGGWEDREVWSFYDINDPGILINVPRLTKK